MFEENKKLEFIELFNDSLGIYEKYKRDYLLVSFIHYEFKKSNPDLDNRFISAKLNDIINTYRRKKKTEFDKEKYIACTFVWENLNQYLLTLFSYLSYNKVMGNDPFHNLNTSIGKTEKLINVLNIGHLAINKINIKKFLKKVGY